MRPKIIDATAPALWHDYLFHGKTALLTAEHQLHADALLVALGCGDPIASTRVDPFFTTYHFLFNPQGE